jgi:murein DD-endopeptidase MepM/ murein hydrolase activator NlpD
MDRMDVFDLNARVQHLGELLNTVIMYEPDDLKREFGLLEDIRQTLAREGVDTPLEQELRDLLRQGIAFDQPLPQGWSDAAQRAIAEAEGLVDPGEAIVWQYRWQTPDGLWSRWHDDPRTGKYDSPPDTVIQQHRVAPVHRSPHRPSLVPDESQAAPWSTDALFQR